MSSSFLRARWSQISKPFYLQCSYGKAEGDRDLFYLLLKGNDPHLYVLLNIEVLWEMPEVCLRAAQWVFYCTGVVQ